MLSSCKKMSFVFNILIHANSMLLSHFYPITLSCPSSAFLFPVFQVLNSRELVSVMTIRNECDILQNLYQVGEWVTYLAPDLSP